MLRSLKQALPGLSPGWMLAGMPWSSVAYEPLWIGALAGAVFSVLRWQIVRRRRGCLGCFFSSVWAWPIAGVGGLVWVAEVIAKSG
jgi:hypothetical protein